MTVYVFLKRKVNIHLVYRLFQALTQQRNRLAAHIRKGTLWLPEPVDNERTCKWCPHQLSCVLYKKRDNIPSGLLIRVNFYPGGLCLRHRIEFDTMLCLGGPSMEITSHLLPSHVEYFDKWSRLIATEAAGDAEAKPKVSSYFWCRTSEEQEKSGNNDD